MAPAFSSNRAATAFSGLVLFFLGLPVLLHWIGRTSLEEAYRGVSERAGPFDFIRRQIFEEHSDVDILFCGSSLLDSGIDASWVQRELSRAIGRQATVVKLRQAWQGPDMNYFVARDLMEHRKVKLLVTGAVARVHFSEQPHVQLFRVIRYGDHPGALDGLGLRYKLAIYADYVLGAPRQALSMLRPNLVDPRAGTAAEKMRGLGYQGRPFVRHTAADPAVPPASAIYSDESRELFRFDGAPLNPFQFHFLQEMVKLARQHGALAAIVHLPSPSERGMSFVPDRQMVPELLQEGAAFAGVPSARLFAHVPDSEFEDYFQDEHVNVNGADLYTEAITPALVQLYEQQTRTH